MRTKPAIEVLLPAVRRAILATLLLHPEREWYFRDLAKHLCIQPSSLTRELQNLTAAGILRRRKDGNRVYYQADRSCPFFPELHGLMVKTAGLVDVLRKLLQPFEECIVSAFIYGSIARAEEASESDIDLMVIGSTGRFELANAVRAGEEQLARPINIALYMPEEFAIKASDNHFVKAVLDREKLFVIGDEHDLERARNPETRRGRTDEQV